MEPMSSMELKILSCKGLTAFNFFQKLCIYVSVSIVFEDPSRNKKTKKHHQTQKTPIDREGDGDPEWKHEMKFDLTTIIDVTSSLPSPSLSSSCYAHWFLEFDLLCGGTILGDKSIGKVRVPFKDLLADDQFNGAAATRFVSYQVQTWDGKPNGVLNFSYKFVGIQEQENHNNHNHNHNNQVVIFRSSSVSENNNSPSVPPPEPTMEVVNNPCPYPPPAVYYPYPSPAQVHHPSPPSTATTEGYYMSVAVAPPRPYPPPARAEMVYYPPPMLPQPMFYPPPQPVPYGYGIGGGYGNPQFGYPMVGQQPHPPYGPYGGAPHKDWQQRDGGSGSRGFSNLSQSQQPSSFLYSVG